MNYYVLLGVAPGADLPAIRKAFRSLARRYHPDAAQSPSPEMFRRVVEAYQTLSDPVRRRAYDRSLQPAKPAPTPVPVEPLAPRPAPAFRVPPLFTPFCDWFGPCPPEPLAPRWTLHEKGRPVRPPFFVHPPFFRR